jgi:multidrug efflux pump subunit AcrA (membrane-fusion protein)
MPGLFVTAEIEGRQMQDVIVLPREALVRRHLVYTLDDDNRVRFEEVEVLAKNEASVWLRTDVPDGTLIVLNKHALLAAGIQVVPAAEPAEADLAGGGTE